MKRFKKIYIEITNKCNLKCSFCSPVMRQAASMSVESFAYVLDEIKPFTDYIYLHVKGEPLIHPDIGDILDISSAKGFHVNITTNGTLIKKVHDILLKSPALRQINFSLHCYDDLPAEFKKDEYLKNIIFFIMEALEKKNIFISLRFWNAGSQGYSTNNNNSIFRFLENEFQLSYKLEDKILPGSGFKISEKLYLNSDYRFAWPQIDDEHEETEGYCLGLKDQAAILSDGTVVPCCLDSDGIISLGNIFGQRFDDIIENERTGNIRKGFLSGKVVEPLCRKCRYKDRFSVE